MGFKVALRDLVRTYQAFDRCSRDHISSFGLTQTQFDVIATLGNQSEMTIKDLVANTLVTKGTITGVLQHLEKDGLINKRFNENDARSQFIKLTPKGQCLFEIIFPRQMNYLKASFDNLTESELKDLSALLVLLKQAFEKNR